MVRFAAAFGMAIAVSGQFACRKDGYCMVAFTVTTDLPEPYGPLPSP